jgi:hypothetical protein
MTHNTSIRHNRHRWAPTPHNPPINNGDTRFPANNGQLFLVGNHSLAIRVYFGQVHVEKVSKAKNKFLLTLSRHGVDTTFSHNARCIQHVSKLNAQPKQVIAWKYPITSLDAAPSIDPSNRMKISNHIDRHSTINTGRIRSNQVRQSSTISQWVRWSMGSIVFSDDDFYYSDPLYTVWKLA